MGDEGVLAGWRRLGREQTGVRGDQELSFYTEMPVDPSSWVQRCGDQGVQAGVYVWVLLAKR